MRARARARARERVEGKGGGEDEDDRGARMRARMRAIEGESEGMVDDRSPLNDYLARRAATRRMRVGREAEDEGCYFERCRSERDHVERGAIVQGEKAAASGIGGEGGGDRMG